MEPPLPSHLHLVTHSGTFHCDDAFAYAVLRLALRLGAPGTDHTLTRTRDPAVIAAADIVWDVGTVHDPAARRFDHHQLGAPTRPDTGLAFSAAGLVWQIHGAAAIAAILPHTSTEMVARVAACIDDDVIRRIDAIDNGDAPPGDTLGLSAIVEDCNPSWDSGLSGSAAAEDAAFVCAADIMAAFLRRRADRVRARLQAASMVLNAHAQGADPRILVMDRKLPWRDAVFSENLPVLYAIYPAGGGNWMIDAMPPEPGSFAQRLPLPAAWAGLQGAILAQVSGVADAVFVHARRFVGAARSKEGALAMAGLAVRAESALARF